MHLPFVRRPHRLLIPLLLFPAGLPGLVGCATPAWDSSWQAPRPLGAELATRRPPRTPGAALPHTVPDEPRGLLRLGEALALALAHNPELAAFSWEVRQAEARTLQAGLRPNPEIGFEVENIAGSGPFRSFDEAETTLQLGQLIETAGKRQKRRRVARGEQDLAGWDYETLRLDVFTETTRRFVAVLAAQEELRLAEERLRLADAVLDTVRVRVREGAASPVERTRARVAVSAARVSRDQAAAELEASRTELAALWGSTEPRFLAVQGDLDHTQAPPAVDVLLARAEQNPDLARWSSEIALREARVELERARRFPNLKVAVGPRYLSGSGDTALVGGVSLPIPLFDRNQGAALAAQYGLARARQARSAAEVRVRSELRVAHRRLEAAFQRVSSISQQSLPAAEAAYQQTLDGFRRGLFRYLDVLDAQRTLFDLRSNRIEALADYHQAVAQLERLSGEALPETQTDRP